MEDPETSQERDIEKSDKTLRSEFIKDGSIAKPQSQILTIWYFSHSIDRYVPIDRSFLHWIKNVKVTKNVNLEFEIDCDNVLNDKVKMWNMKDLKTLNWTIALNST